MLTSNAHFRYTEYINLHHIIGTRPFFLNQNILLWNISSASLSLGDGFMLEKLMETVSYGRDPTWEKTKSLRSLPPEEKGVAETMWDELIAAPHSPLVSLRGRRQRKSERSWARKEGRSSGRCFQDLSLFLTILLWFDW